ncbi:MAG TPA: N-acetyltransferase [Polyangiaceae bacterium]|nr:N-acetyltransferase [Polyangiaceae bacterium]
MTAPAAPGALLVEPLGDSIHDQIACMLLDARVFPWSSAWFVAPPRRLGRPLWVVRPGAGAPAVGFLAACERQHHLYVQGLAVDPGMRRRGAGAALLRHAARYAWAQAMNELVLHVMPSNRAAVGLYAREGFVACRRVPRFYSDGTEALEMRLRLGAGG